jgi:hypothetical protein
LTLKENNVAHKRTRRKRTPSLMIRPNVEGAIASMLDAGHLLSRREIAAKAGISQQTLYAKALDLVEAAEKRWAASQVDNSDATSVHKDLRRKEQQLNAEIVELNRKIDDMAEMMAQMIEAVQIYAPNALSEVTKILARPYQKKKPI